MATAILNTDVRFVVIGQRSGYGGAWGKGVTLAEAKKNFTRLGGGSLSKGYTVASFPDGGFDGIDEIGRVHYLADKPIETTEVKARKQAA